MRMRSDKLLKIQCYSSDLGRFFSEWAHDPFKKISMDHSEFQWAMLSYEWAIVNEINFQHNNA